MKKLETQSLSAFRGGSTNLSSPKGFWSNLKTRILKLSAFTEFTQVDSTSPVERMSEGQERVNTVVVEQFPSCHPELAAKQGDALQRRSFMPLLGISGSSVRGVLRMFGGKMLKQVTGVHTCRSLDYLDNYRCRCSIDIT